MTEWASCSEELARKVLGVIETRVYECQVEKLYDEATLKTILNSLNDTVSGLVPWEIADLIAKAIKEIDTP